MELKPYPFPSGMAIPRLMPFQEFPWNGDGYLAEEVLRLKEVHGLKTAIETGTCLGSTMIWLEENFEEVNTCEINGEYRSIAVQRGMDYFMAQQGFNLNTGITSHTGESVEMLKQVTADFYFLDAHWNDHCPLLDELDAIAKAGIRPCILIHDFLVPGHEEMGFDRMPDGRPFDIELIWERMDAIYGEGGWKHNYPEQVTGANRGWISIEPA